MQTLIARRQGMGLRVSSVVSVALALMVSVLLFLWNPGVVYACKCAAPGAPAEELAKFDAVFTGRVISIEHSFDPNGTTVSPEDRTTVGFEVSNVWKGNILKSMDVTTPPTGGSCGFAFIEGEEYIVYASDSAYGDNGYTVSICSRTALLEEAQADIDELGEGNAPQAETGAPSAAQPEGTVAVVQQWIMILAVAAGVILLVGFAVFVGMRRR